MWMLGIQPIQLSLNFNRSQIPAVKESVFF